MPDPHPLAAEPSMRVVDARWTPTVNVLTIACRCGHRLDHRADRTRIRCRCGRSDDLHRIRDAAEAATAELPPLMAAALGYAARGWAVFPLVPGEKRPAVTAWEDRATTDPHRIRRCWAGGDYGIGVACGPSALVVLDLDVPKPGRPPLPEAWRAEGADCGLDVLAIVADRAAQPFPAGTYTVRTGRGGTHLYFTHPAGMELRNTAGQLGPLIDTRAQGGYVVAPPTTVNDRPYRVAADVAVAPLPGWLAEALAPAPLPPQEAVSVDLSPDRRGVYLRSALAAETARVTGSPAGGRNTALYRAAVALGQLVAGGELHAGQVTAVLAQAAAQVGKEPRETARTIASGLRAGARRPRRVAA